MAAYQRVHGNAAGPRHASMAECNGVIDQPGRSDGHEGNFSTTRVTANHGPLAMPFKSIDFSSAVAYAVRTLTGLHLAPLYGLLHRSIQPQTFPSLLKPVDAHCCRMQGTAIKHPPVPDRIKLSFVIFDTAERQSARLVSRSIVTNPLSRIVTETLDLCVI